MTKPLVSLNPGEYETSSLRLAAFDINRIASDLKFIARDRCSHGDSVREAAHRLQQIAEDILEVTRENSK